MFRSNCPTARRFCLVLIVLAATALSVPSGQPTAATYSYPAVSADGGTTASGAVNQAAPPQLSQAAGPNR